jgi:hypothetical protein
MFPAIKPWPMTKVEAHKEAVRLNTQEKEKPEGARMSSKQVQDHIQKKHDTRPSFWIIQQYAEEGLVNVSPEKWAQVASYQRGHTNCFALRYPASFRFTG